VETKSTNDVNMKIAPVKIGRNNIGTGYPCYVIAEIGSNFDGSLSKAKKLAKLAKNSGANAAKFQSFQTEKIISPTGFKKKSTFQSRWKKSVWDVYKNAEFPLSWHKELNEYCKKIGIDFLSAPYFQEAVDLLKVLNVPAIKIGSGEITDIEFLKYVGKTNKPIFLATGASDMKEVTKAVNAIKITGNNQIILMQAITQYPSPIENSNLKVIESFRQKFRLNVGYSDHSPGSLVILGSVALGSCVIEKHFTDDLSLSGPDHPHSMCPKNFREMVTQIRLLESAMGDGIKKVEKCEKETRIIQRRGIWTTKKILKGEKFTNYNIQTLRPVSGIDASQYRLLLGKKSKKSLKPYSPIKSNYF